MRTPLVAGIALAALLLAAGCAPSAGTGGSTAPKDASPAANLVRERCSACHNLDRIKSANKDAAGWRSTVIMMRTSGAKLTDAEVDQVVEFLAAGGAAGL